MKVIREPYTKLFLLLHTSKGADLKSWVKYDEQKEYNKPLRDKKGQQEKTIPGKAERMKAAEYVLQRVEVSMNRKPLGWGSSEMTLPTSGSSRVQRVQNVGVYCGRRPAVQNWRTKSCNYFFYQKLKGFNKSTWRISTNAVTKGCAKLSGNNLMYCGVRIRPRPC